MLSFLPFQSSQLIKMKKNKNKETKKEDLIVLFGFSLIGLSCI